METKQCPLCGKMTSCEKNGPLNQSIFFDCPVCGRYEIDSFREFEGFDINKLSFYLYYNAFYSDTYVEYRYHTLIKKQGHKEDVPINKNSVFLEPEIVESWYPKTMDEKIGLIIEKIGKCTKHPGQKIHLTKEELISLLFVDRVEPFNGNKKIRDDKDITNEIKYIIKYLDESGQIKSHFLWESKQSEEQGYISILLLPDGYRRIEEMHKNTSNSRNVLVAMKFGEETDELRKNIRKGISDAGFHAIFIDEVQHNDFITPELLKQIKLSKFVVVDLTHENNGAYFEEGYAMGLGKPVIQLCKKDTHLHFDIAQKNTIMWETEDKIPEALSKRIEATID